MATVKIILAIKDQAYIDANPDKVLDVDEPIWREDGYVAFGDGVTTLENLIFKPVFSGSEGTFTGLSDTPDIYTGQGGKGVFVKTDETGLEFVNASGGSTDFSSVPITSKSRRFAAIPKADGAGNWSLLDDANHTPQNFSGISVVGGTILRLTYTTPLVDIHSFAANSDSEGFNNLIIGFIGGLSSLDIYALQVQKTTPRQAIVTYTQATQTWAVTNATGVTVAWVGATDEIVITNNTSFSGVPKWLNLFESSVYMRYSNNLWSLTQIWFKFYQWDGTQYSRATLPNGFRFVIQFDNTGSAICTPVNWTTLASTSADNLWVSGWGNVA